MAQAIDEFPVRDKLVNPATLQMSDVWAANMSGFYMNLIGYLTQYGMLLPQLTQAQINSIQEPVGGQFVYNSETGHAQYYNSITDVWTII